MKNKSFLKNSIYIFLFIFLTGILSCTNPTDTKADAKTADAKTEVKDDGSVTRIWKLKEIDLLNFPEENNPLSYNRRKLLGKGYYISLFPDNTGTIIEHSECEPFKWTHDKETNKIKLQGALKYTAYKEIDVVREDGQTKLVASIPGSGQLILEPYCKHAQYMEEDPFHPVNNKWRIRKQNNENKKELSLKADNYLQHVRYLFKARLDNPNRRFSTVNSSGVLNIYNGGIGMVEKGKISEDWYSYFYKKEQAIEAWKLVRKRIGKNTLRSKSGGDWIQANYDALVEKLDSQGE